MEAQFDAAVHTLYAVMAFFGAVIVSMIAISNFKNRSTNKTNHLLIFLWVIYFCIQDGVWGLFASHALKSDTGLMIVSYIFHFSAITSSTVWVIYFLSKFKGRIKHPINYLGTSIVLTLVQYGMLIGNIFSKFMFYVDEYGFYRTTPYRSIMFYIQLAEYFIIGIVTIVTSFRVKKNEEKENLTAIFAINVAPIMFGLLQMVYPDAPFDSLGFTVACVIIYTFLSRDFEQQVVDLKQLRTELNNALEKAEYANRTKTSFLFNMSHDIRTPMNAIMGFTNIAIKNIDDREKVLDSLNKTKESSDILLSMINDILEMSRIESGKNDLNIETCNVKENISSLESVMTELADAKRLDLKFVVRDVRDETVKMDINRVNRVLLNLGGNSIKYTKEGSVTITLRQLPSEKEGIGLYEYTVEDTGIGMSEEFQTHMFEEFARESNSTTSGIQGTGLGLSVTKSFVELMNGTITCESKLGKGTKTVVVLPFEIAGAAADTAEESYSDEEVRAALEGKSLLLVEDNEMNREIALDILEDVAAFNVDTAENGKIAVDKLKEAGPSNYDCILMDIQMPVMDGYEASRAIREMYPDSDIRIIALSANAFEEDRQNSLQAGMDDHLAKPIEPEKLRKMLMRFLK